MVNVKYIIVEYINNCTKRFKYVNVICCTMIELSIPQIDEESKNVKDLVFTILTQEQPLSIIELTNRVKKEYALGVTYQAVRKAVNTLQNQHVLTKNGKKYSLNKEWILKTKSFFDTLLTTYDGKTKIKLFSTEVAKEDYAVYTFNTLLDLDNFWGDIMLYWADHEKENKEYLSITHYNWWMIINLGRETKLFDSFKKKRIKSSFLTPVDLPLNRWASNIYTQMGVKTKITPLKDESTFVDINIMGNMVIQVHYPQNILKKIKNFFEKYKNVQEVPLKEITRLAHEQGEIKFVLFKNKTIAKNLRDLYTKYF